MKYTIELNPSMYFTHEGMAGSVFIGDSDEGCEFNMSWEELIEDEFEMQTIPNQKADTLTLDAAQEVHELINAFEDAAKKMRERLTNSLILDRKAWLEANDGELNQANRDEFLKYFSYDMVTDNE